MSMRRLSPCKFLHTKVTGLGRSLLYRSLPRAVEDNHMVTGPSVLFTVHRVAAYPFRTVVCPFAKHLTDFSLCPY
jgi:hypothetical protein